MRTRTLYIGGTGRSGSTVIAQLLAAVPGLIPVGELRYVWERGFAQNQLCGCGQPFRDCPFWRGVVTVAYGDGRVDVPQARWLAGQVDRIRFTPQLGAPALRSARFQRLLGRYANFLCPLYAAILQVSGGRVVVDSSKDPSYAFVLRALGCLDLSMLQLVRDPRAVAHSWSRERLRPEIHWTRQHMQRRTPPRSAVVWNEHNALFEVLGRAHPAFRRVRYEDFTAAPAATIDQIVQLAGEVPGPQLPPAQVFRHSVSGNPIRFEKTRPVITADVEWRTAMSPADRRLVTALTAPLMVRYGYLRN